MGLLREMETINKFVQTYDEALDCNKQVCASVEIDGIIIRGSCMACDMIIYDDEIYLGGDIEMEIDLTKVDITYENEESEIFCLDNGKCQVYLSFV